MHYMSVNIHLQNQPHQTLEKCSWYVFTVYIILFRLNLYLIFFPLGFVNVPAYRQPAPIVAQPTRQSVIQFAPRVVPQGDIQITPQIFVPDIPASSSNILSEDEICMAAMDEFENQDDNTG